MLVLGHLVLCQPNRRGMLYLPFLPLKSCCRPWGLAWFNVWACRARVGHPGVMCGSACCQHMQDVGHIAATGAKVVVSCSAEQLTVHDVVIKTSELRLLAKVGSSHSFWCPRVHVLIHVCILFLGFAPFYLSL